MMSATTPPREDRTRPEPDVRTPAPVERRKCVLVVDDSEDVRALLVDTLTDAGRLVLEASNGQEALAVLEEARRSEAGGNRPVDLLVTDYCMPGITGLDLVRALRRNGNPIAVLLMTGVVDDALRRDGQGCGVDEMIAKPFTIRAMMEAVDRLLGRP